MKTQEYISSCNDLRAIWRSFKIDPSKFDCEKYYENSPFLSSLIGVGSTFIFVYDLYNENYAFISDNLKTIYGYDPEEFKKYDLETILGKVHPDDQHHLCYSEKTYMDIIASMPPQQRNNIRCSTDYRFQTTDGKYLRVLQQKVVLETNTNGYPVLVMALVSDISGIKSDERCSLSIQILEEGKGWKDITPQKNLTGSTLKFTKREKEILRLLIQGKSSKLIAHELNVSFHTINNHRSNLLVKTGAKNSTELVRLCVLNHIL